MMMCLGESHEPGLCIFVSTNKADVWLVLTLPHYDARCRNIPNGIKASESNPRIGALPSLVAWFQEGLNLVFGWWLVT